MRKQAKWNTIEVWTSTEYWFLICLINVNSYSQMSDFVSIFWNVRYSFFVAYSTQLWHEIRRSILILLCVLVDIILSLRLYALNNRRRLCRKLIMACTLVPALMRAFHSSSVDINAALSRYELFLLYTDTLFRIDSIWVIVSWKFLWLFF